MGTINIVLYQPEIPQNTGNIMRTCVATNTILHLIEPLGFSLEEKEIKRSGANYVKDVKYYRYSDWNQFLEKNKPENIYYYKDRFYIGDFGLVSFLDDEVSFTESCALGAYSTMAPEMRRNPHLSDGKKADVYSLAKTLWIMLTKNKKGFDGVYDFRDEKIGLRYNSIVSNIHIVELEELLHKATDNDPDKRPNMLEFMNSLQQWLDMKPSDFYSTSIQCSEWRFINNYLFLILYFALTFFTFLYFLLSLQTSHFTGFSLDCFSRRIAL